MKETLKWLMSDREVTQTQLSKETGIPKTTINGWLCADRLPDFNSLIKLANYFDVSIDFLCGRTTDIH